MSVSKGKAWFGAHVEISHSFAGCTSRAIADLHISGFPFQRGRVPGYFVRLTHFAQSTVISELLV